jgi:hypothetical protein
MVGGVEIIDNSKLNSTKTASPPAIHMPSTFAIQGPVWRAGFSPAAARLVLDLKIRRWFDA